MVERLNRLLGSTVVIYSDLKGTDWDLRLPLIMFWYRLTPIPRPVCPHGYYYMDFHRLCPYPSWQSDDSSYKINHQHRFMSNNYVILWTNCIRQLKIVWSR